MPPFSVERHIMVILFIGDVVGTPGCNCLRKLLPAYKKLKNVDFCIVNGENSAPGNGILPQSADHLFASGADLITTGNHALRRSEIYSVLDGNLPIIRPVNFHREAPGRGWDIIEKRGLRLAVVNLMGSLWMDYAENPYDAMDYVLKEIMHEGIKNILVDFHAEATAEKRSMGFYLDGKVSAMIGTHTHVQTADEQILPNGTAYLTDAGMTGVIHSVLGVNIHNSTHRIRTGLPMRFEQCEGTCRMDGVLIETDNKTGKAVSIERVSIAE